MGLFAPKHKKAGKHPPCSEFRIPRHSHFEKPGHMVGLHGTTEKIIAQESAEVSILSLQNPCRSNYSVSHPEYPVVIKRAVHDPTNCLEMEPRQLGYYRDLRASQVDFARLLCAS